MALTKGLTRYQRTTYCHELITLFGASTYFFFVAIVVLVVFGAVVVFVATVVTVDFKGADTGAAPTWEIPTKEAAKAIPTVAIVFFITLSFVKQDHLVSFQ